MILSKLDTVSTPIHTPDINKTPMFNNDIKNNQCNVIRDIKSSDKKEKESKFNSKHNNDLTVSKLPSKEPEDLS